MNLSNETLINPRPRISRRETRWVWQPHWRVSNWIFILMALFAAGLVLLVPAYLIVRSVSSGNEVWDILSRAQTFTVLFNTLLLSGSVTLAATAVAVPVAWLTSWTDLPAKRLWAILATLPLVLPSYVAAYIFMTILAPKGLLQQFFEPIGLQRMPSFVGFPGAFLVLTCVSYPYILLTVRASMLRMDPSLLEAARSLGLSPSRAFWRVTLPHLRPSILAGGLLVALYVIRDFGAVTMWQYSTFTRIIYNRYLSYKLDAAAALALILVVLTLIILYFEQRSRGKARYERLSSGTARARRPVVLGYWKWPAFLFLSILLIVSLLLPTAGLITWLWRGWQQDLAGSLIGGSPSNMASLWNLLVPAWNSLSISLIAALLTLLLALPVVILTVRHSSRAGRWLERLTYTSFALPGIVVALALVFFGIHFARSIYQTLPLLLAAYVILFLPQAIGSQRASLLQVSRSMEEAARCLGKRPFAVLRQVTIPLVRPGFLAGGMLVFLTVMKELPATLILSPLGFSTLATQIWTNINEAFFARAALPTLLLLLLSSLPLALLTLRDK